MKIAPDDCDLCPALAGCRTQVVHGIGPSGGIMVVGSSPHQWDDERNEPFSGKEGTLLRHICEAAGMPADKVYRAQAVKCRTPGDRTAKKAEIDACHQHLLAEIRAVKPKVIIALGGEALQSLYGGDNSDDYEQQLFAWEQDVVACQTAYEDAVSDWNRLSKEERVEAFPNGKPKRAEFKPPLKPKKPKASKAVAIRDVAGHSLIQPDTGIPIVATYSPRYIMRKRWHLVDIVVSHFKKAWRMHEGDQVIGGLGDYAVLDTIDQVEALRDYLLSDDVDIIWFDCVEPETPILTHDLRWVPAASLQAGDMVMGFDEDGSRKWRTSVVTNNFIASSPSRRMRLSDGREIQASFNHRWLTKKGGVFKWKTMEDIQPGDVIASMPMWDEDKSYHAGLLAGAFGADGSIARGKGGSTLQFAQVKNGLRTAIHEALNARGFTYGESASHRAGTTAQGITRQQDNFVTFVTGGIFETLRFLGSVRPPRMLAKWLYEQRLDGRQLQTQSATVLFVEDCGVQPVCVLSTDAKTYVAGGAFAHNCETTGLKWMDDEVLCWQFAGCEGEGYVVPLLWNPGDGDPNHPENGQVDLHPAWGEPEDFRKLIRLLRDIFESNKPKGGHNVLFDRRMLERDSKQDFITAVTGFAIKVNGPIVDTELTHVAVAESLPHNMTSVLANETDMPYYEQEVRDHKKAMAKAPNGPVWTYGAADADGLPRMYKPLRARSEAEGTDWVLDHVTLPMLDVCRDIEERGFLVDMEHFKKLCLFYHDQQRIWEEKLWAAVPHRDEGWKYNHPATLTQVLFKELKLPVSGRKTKSSKECDACAAGVCFDHDQTGKDALQDIFKLQPHPVIPILLRLKKITKMIGTYLDGKDGKGGFTKYFRADGRIHPTMKISRAETGRLASEAPNAQNMVNYLHIHPIGAKCSEGDKCKEFFPETFGINSENAYHDIVIAKPGYGIMNADWSQAEVWGLAYRLLKYTNDRTLLDVLESGVDIHTWMARKMYPHLDATLDDGEWKGKHPAERRRAKTCIFGIGYGLTVQGFALREGCTEEEAQETIDLYMDVVPGLKKLFAIVRWHLLKYGYIPNEFGRRRHINTLHLLQAMRERGEFEGLVREGINFPIQSSCSDLHSMASYATFKSPVIAARHAGIILTVHDSLTFEFWYPNEDEAVKTAHLIKDLWQKIAWNTIKPDGQPLHWKIPVEVEWGNCWGTPAWKLDAKGTLKKLTHDVKAEEDKAVVWEEDVDPVTDKVISFEPTRIDTAA